MKKVVHATAHEFDCLPGHVRIAAFGSGATLRVAAMRAIEGVMSDSRLAKKRPNSFKCSFVVTREQKGN